MTLIRMHYNTLKFIQPQEDEKIYIKKCNEPVTTMVFTRQTEICKENYFESKIIEETFYTKYDVFGFKIEKLVGIDRYLFNVPKSMLKSGKKVKQLFEIGKKGHLVCYLR